MILKQQELPIAPSLNDKQDRYIEFSVMVLIGLLIFINGCSLFRYPVPVHVIDDNSACARLRTSYPSEHGLVLFNDQSTKVRSIPWCFPKTAGMGVLGYTINIRITRSGTFTLVLSDIMPPTQFAAVNIDGNCYGDNTGKSYVWLGYGTQWSMPVAPGDYCISIIKSENDKEDVWFTLTATRP